MLWGGISHPPPHAPSSRGRRGAALITVIIILFFLGALGTALIGMVYERLSAITLELDRLQANYLAEAGLAQALYEIRTGLDTFGGGLGSVPVTYLGSGVYRVTQYPEVKTLVAVGMVRDVRREIVSKY